MLENLLFLKTFLLTGIFIRSSNFFIFVLQLSPQSKMANPDTFFKGFDFQKTRKISD